MAINWKQLQSWLIFGAVGGIILGLVVPFVIGLLVQGTGISGITFATYDVRASITSYANQGNPFMAAIGALIGIKNLPGGEVWAVVFGALGLGVAMAFVRFVAGFFNIELGKNKIMIVALVAGVLMGSVVAGKISGPEFQITPLLIFGATGWLISWLMTAAYKQFNMSLPQ
jgi:hypothetical protein